MVDNLVSSRFLWTRVTTLAWGGRSVLPLEPLAFWDKGPFTSFLCQGWGYTESTPLTLLRARQVLCCQGRIHSENANSMSFFFLEARFHCVAEANLKFMIFLTLASWVLRLQAGATQLSLCVLPFNVCVLS